MSVEAVEQCEARLRQAMLASDVAALESLLGDTLVFTNQLGVRMTREEDLAAHRSGLLALDRIDVRDMAVRVLGDAAVVTLTADIAGRHAGQPFGGSFAYTRLWSRAGGEWRVEAAHCSEVATG